MLALLTCPFCGHHGQTEVDVYFGELALYRYRLGDACRWVPGRPVAHGGRPEGGDLDGEGYVECVGCGRDWFAVVSVRGDRFAEVRPDPVRSGYAS